ncbi:MAG: protein kinase [Deltaproteobacteria bacterium]|nr:protein kinase [Deltaproteobacteria bacterium]
MALAGKKRKIFDGRYEILSIVGRGACSVVYHARHAVAPSSEVALKVLLNEKDQKASGEKLRKEALAMVSSRHKYVVRLDDFHSVGELCYLSMEFAPESDLRKYAAKTAGKLNPIQAELFLLQVAEALAFIHRAGIVHRDIKPDNILVVNAKEIRLADFGVAVLPGEKSSLAELQKGVGTMDYMAPEVLEGKMYDLKSDIYALGVTFYELLSGTHPFANAPLVEQLSIRKDGKFPHLRELAPAVPTYLSNVIMQAMSYEPSARFPSTKELAQALLVNRGKPATTPAASTNAAPSPAVQTPAAATARTSPPPVSTTPTAAAATAPSAAVLAAIKAASSKLPPSSPSAKPPGLLTGDTPEARRAAASALLGKASTGTPTASAGNTALAQPQAKPSPAPTSPTTKTTTSVEQTSTVTSPTPTPAARPVASPMREVSPTQIISRATVNEVTSGKKEGGSLLSRAFDASAAVSEPQQTKSERSSEGLESSPPAVDPLAQTQPIDPRVMASAIAAAGKSETAAPTIKSPTSSENAKPTQLITRDLVNQVRQGMKSEMKPQARSTKAEPRKSAAPQPQQPKKDLAPAVIPDQKKDLWKKDPKKSRYMAISMGILLVILWFGNIFLIKNYHIGIGKSFLGYEEEIVSPIPQYSAAAVDFPAIPSGMYSGLVRNFAGGRTVPLTIISFGEQKKVAVILGLEGWTPAVASFDPNAKKSDGAASLRIVSNGLVLNMTGQGAGNELSGTFEDVITGDQSAWHATPVTH